MVKDKLGDDKYRFVPELVNAHDWTRSRQLAQP